MLKSDPQKRELTLPVDAWAAVRDVLSDEMAEDAARRLLASAGTAAGRALAPLLSAQDPDALRSLPRDAFWRKLADMLAGRGWGRLQQLDTGDGLGALQSADWAETRVSHGQSARPSCHFSAAMIAALLGYAAGADVAVAETHCRAAGDDYCRFVFGAPSRVAAAHPGLPTAQAAG